MYPTMYNDMYALLCPHYTAMYFKYGTGCMCTHLLIFYSATYIKLTHVLLDDILVVHLFILWEGLD